MKNDPQRPASYSFAHRLHNRPLSSTPSTQSLSSCVRKTLFNLFLFMLISIVLSSQSWQQAMDRTPNVPRPMPIHINHRLLRPHRTAEIHPRTLITHTKSIRKGDELHVPLHRRLFGAVAHNSSLADAFGNQTHQQRRYGCDTLYCG